MTISNPQELNLVVLEPPTPNLYTQEIIVQIDGTYGYAIGEIPLNVKLEAGSKIKIKGSFTYQDSEEKYIKYLNSKRVFYKLEVDQILAVKNTGLIYNLQTIRRSLINTLGRSLGGESGGLLNGILLGTEGSLSNRSLENLKQTGTTHIISASGFNVMVIFILIRSTLFFCKRTYRNIVAIAFSIVYVLMIGWFILPALRALFMLAILTIGKEFGRKVSNTFLILSSISLILLQYPFYYKNISFQLSLFATSSLFIFSPSIQSWLDRNKLPEILSENISATFAVLIGTIPISFLAFGQISIISPLANLLTAPLVPILMYLGLLLIIFQLTELELLAKLAIFIAKIITSIFFKIIYTLSNLEISTTKSKSIALLFLISIILCFILFDKNNIEKRYKG